ncbi:MAG: DUF4446 family protein [Alicyclobacillus sp.]|nr:DUF4446 family protein [Alicyclobacillus sp.]
MGGTRLTDWPSAYTNIIILVSACIALLGFIIGLMGIVSAKRLQKSFKRWKQIHSTADLEAVYAETLDRVSAVQAELKHATERINALEARVATKVSTPRVLRYNAFADQGSDLSFSVALLDDNSDGVVISSIYGRDESRVYGKPIQRGSSAYTLTDEEIEVLESDQHALRERGRPVHT